MPEYLYPGVYIEEMESAVTPIPGVATSIDDVLPQSPQRVCAVLVRPHFFNGRLLDAATLAAEQDYHREKLRRHNRALLGYGVVSGLGVVIEGDPNGSHVVVEPGYAIDHRGEEVALPAGATLRTPKCGDEALVTLRYWEHAHSSATPGANGQLAPAMLEEACIVALAPSAVAPAIALARLLRFGDAWQIDAAFLVPRIRCVA